MESLVTLIQWAIYAFALAAVVWIFTLYRRIASSREEAARVEQECQTLNDALNELRNVCGTKQRPEQFLSLVVKAAFLTLLKSGFSLTTIGSAVTRAGFKITKELYFETELLKEFLQSEVLPESEPDPLVESAEKILKAAFHRLDELEVEELKDVVIQLTGLLGIDVSRSGENGGRAGT